MRRFILYTFILFACTLGNPLLAQDQWIVPATDAQKLSPYIFNDEMKADGLRIYENSCNSCHGNPGTGNFAKLSPSPGDPAADKFQSQTDGSLFYKIRKGRGAMPSFENVLSEEETWGIIAYFREFNKNYVQKTAVDPNEKKVKLTATLLYDDNIYNLVVKAFADSVPEKDINVSAFVKSHFGMYALPKTLTNNLGIAYIPVDNDLPSDSAGNLVFFVKLSKGSNTTKITDTLKVNSEPTIRPAVTEGRHLWSTGKMAPIWLKITFWGTVLGLWATILFIVIGLLGIKKLK